MSYLPPKAPDPKRQRVVRWALWIGIAAFAVFSIVSGVVGILQHR